MMTLYSGTTDPYSHRCRFVLFEKGMDFEVIDVDVFNMPEDLAVMNPYNKVPVLVERDLILYEANIINEYIDERFPHPQLMPPDPVMRARARLFLHRFEQSGLHLRWCPVNLVSEKEISKNWSFIGIEFRFRLIVHLPAGQISWKKIRSELNSCRMKSKRTRNTLNRKSFCKSWNSFKENVSS